MFIEEECENLIVVNNGGKLTCNINQKRLTIVYIDAHSVKNTVDESISSVIMWNIVNQLGKHDFSCGLVVNNLKDRKLFLIN